MTREVKSWRVIYMLTTSHQVEGQYGVAYVWASDRKDARRVFFKNYNNKNSDNTLSSISYEILQIDGDELGQPSKEKVENRNNY